MSTKKEGGARSGGGGRIRDIKDTASDAVEIIRELRTPEVQETLDKVKLLTDSARSIMAELKTPEWVRNIDNFRIMTQNIDNTSARAESMVKELKNMEIVNETTMLVKGARTTLGSFDGEGKGAVGNDIRDTIVAVREMFESLRSLADELRITISDPKARGIFDDVSQTAKDVSSTIETIKSR
jgi:hypothetical protein